MVLPIPILNVYVCVCVYVRNRYASVHLYWLVTQKVYIVRA